MGKPAQKVMHAAVAAMLLGLIFGTAQPLSAMEKKLNMGLSVRETYDTSFDYQANEDNLVTNISSSLNYSARDQRTTYAIGTGLGYTLRHSDENSGRLDLGSLGMSASHAVSPRLSTNLDVNIQADQTTEEASQQFAIIVDPQLRVSGRFSAGAGYSLDELNSISGSLSHSRQLVGGEDVADTESYSLSGSWSRRISELSSLGIFTSVSQSMSENEGSETVSNYLSMRANYSYSYAEDWSFRFGIGPSFSRTESKEEFEIDGVTSTRETTNYVTTYSVSSSANWKINERTGSSFSLSRGQTQSVLGDNVVNYRLNSRVAYDLSDRSDISLSLNYSRSSRTGEDEESESQNYGISSNYGYVLTDKLRLTVNYSYNEQHDITGDDFTTRHRLSLGLSTSFTSLLD